VWLKPQAVRLTPRSAGGQLAYEMPGSRRKKDRKGIFPIQLQGSDTGRVGKERETDWVMSK